MYRGRLAPTPSGALHLGHACTFLWAAQRAAQAQGTLILRMEDLDSQRCKPVFAEKIIEDLRALGIHWQEGPDVGGPYGPYIQSQRKDFYRVAWEQLRQLGIIYPCTRSRKDLSDAIGAPHEDGDAEHLFPIEWRAPVGSERLYTEPAGVNWRFRVPDGRQVVIEDGLQGRRCFEAGKDFGDFLIWRRDDMPTYELAVVVDDAAMAITEVVRGADLLKSTARQYLVYEALGIQQMPAFYHTPLVRDPAGKRLAKRDQATSLAAMHERGDEAAAVLEYYAQFKKQFLDNAG
ncbi:MAG: tRNA glutamyl-Q synthetase [Verrucomicrobia bacterium 21-51-4]|nr:MAG: tRNA glutamyl-Q synthetase [Verrucomicrobia bacterium 21-51-4]HQU08425.1 glutamate--tRNA ligase family protein [Opitutales bacterium]